MKLSYEPTALVQTHDLTQHHIAGEAGNTSN